MHNDNFIKDHITLAYKGPHVEKGKMDALEVANNIIAFNDFIGVVSRTAYGEKIDLKTEIQGFRGDSFDIDFALVIGGCIANLLLTAPLSPKDMIELLKESIKAWLHLKGQPPKETKTYSDNENLVQIENQTGQLIYCPRSVINIISDNKAGKAVEQFIKKPLDAGVSNLSIMSSSFDEIASIDETEASSFVPIAIEKPLYQAEIQMGLVIESPTFKEGNKWKFWDGQNSFYAEIFDKKFLERVDKGIERFGKGDILLTKVRITQASTLDSLKMDRAIIEVIEHKEGPFQENLLPD